MTELLNTVVQKTGLPMDKAKGAIEAVLGWLKGRLPAALGGQIDSAVAGANPAEANPAAAAAKGLGGMLGR